MRLSSCDGASVELRPVRYEFPAAKSVTAGDERDEWDANWLVVRGDVRVPGGRGWSFTDPCLTTWEAGDLGRWLRRVTARQVARCPDPDEGTDEVLSFTEPNLAFSLAEQDPHAAHIRVHLSAEATPPWMAGDARWRWDAFCLSLQVGIEEIRHAAERWEWELAPFPIR